jgi:hypothetical protein
VVMPLRTIRNQQVAGSIPAGGSRTPLKLREFLSLENHKTWLQLPRLCHSIRGLIALSCTESGQPAY